MKVLITGGHHNPAIPLIHELRRRNSQVEIVWLGHKHTLLHDKNETLEYKEITKLGIPFYELHAGKVYRTYNLFRLIKVPFGFLEAFYLLVKLKPDVIVSFGGYLAVPVVFGGYVLKIPSVTHEQTVVVGYANKFISLFAKKIFISWTRSARHFDPKKVIYSGLPIRDSIKSAKSNSIELNADLKTIYITGGKTGSLKINEFVLDNMKTLLSSYNIIHQCGDYSVKNDYERLKNQYLLLAKTVPGSYVLKKFIMEDEIGEVFSKSNLVVSRSGANITAELLYLKKPCVLIPIPWVSHNEQYENAKMLVDAGLGVILTEKELRFADAVNVLTSAITNLHKIKTQESSTVIPEKIIADEIQKLVRV